MQNLEDLLLSQALQEIGIEFQLLRFISAMHFEKELKNSDVLHISILRR